MVKRRYTDDQLRDAVARAKTYADVCRLLGLVPRGGNYENIRCAIVKAGIDASRLERRLHQFRQGRAILFTDEALRHAVATSRSIVGVIRALDEEPTSARRRSVQRAIERLEIDTSHMTGQGWRLGSRKSVVPAKPLVELLIAGRTFQSRHLKRRLLQEGIKEHRCEHCGLSEWQDDPIPLEIDHINGRRDDNRLENIRLLCPNCHALTPTYRGRNIGRYASEARVPYHLHGRGRSQIRHRREA